MDSYHNITYFTKSKEVVTLIILFSEMSKSSKKSISSEIFF